MTNRNDNFNADAIKANIYGLASTLLVVTNTIWKSDVVVAYRFVRTETKNDNNLNSNLFGRVCTDNAFKADKQCINVLDRFYKSYAIDFVITVQELETIAQEHNCNLGYAAEIALVNSGLYKKASAKYDRKGVDLIEKATNKLVQVKCSVVKPNSHGSAGTTNKKAH